MNLKETIEQMGSQARRASLKISQISAEEKKQALLHMSKILIDHSEKIVEANKFDLAQAKKMGLTSAMQSRLFLDSAKVSAIANSIKKVANLPDPLERNPLRPLQEWTCPNGMKIAKISVPIGVIGIIYESRPNVTSDAATLCFKSGNATILRGGKEAFHSNTAIATALRQALAEKRLPEDSIQLVPSVEREGVKHMTELDKFIDLIIPRGGQGLIETVVSLARMPVIKHYDGICHLYVDSKADIDMAVKLSVDSKVQKPGVCNALETLLVHEKIADDFLPKFATALEGKVELRGDEKTIAILPDIKKANDSDWSEEYLDLILAIKTVKDLDDAIEHINTYGSHHTDSICTQDSSQAELFLAKVDSAVVLHNVSTRFSDGEEFGFGAEIGISTDKIHARGPMGLEELTSYKYIVIGNGQTKVDNSNMFFDAI